MKKVLFLSPYPEHCAPSQRLKYEQYFRMFEAEGYEVKTSSFVSKPFWEILYKEGHFIAKIIFTLIGYLHRISDLFQLHKYDVVYVHLWVTPIGPPIFERLVRWRAKHLIYDIDDMVFLGHHSHANRLFSFLKGREKMIHLMKYSDHVITCTPKLDEFVKNYTRNTTDISSTINTETYIADQNKSIDKEEIILGWSGSHSTSKYLHLLDGVIKDLSKKYNIKLKVIGDSTFQIEGVKVEAISWNEETEIKELKEFDIGLYPLPDEEWVYGKSGLKALQYMALGIPTIATAIGANFRVVEDGVSGTLVKPNNDLGWISAIEELIEDREKYSRFSKAGVERVKLHYSLTANLKHYLNALNSTIDVSLLIPSLDKGGAEKIAAMTANYIASDKRVEVVLMDDTVFQSLDKKVTIYKLTQRDKRSVFLKLIGIYRSSKKYRRYVQRKRPEQSISFLNRPNFINVLATSNMANVKTVINERSYPPKAYEKSNLVNWITRKLIDKLYLKADLIVSNSSLSADYFKEVFPSKKNQIKVWNNPIDLTDITQPRTGILDKNVVRILNVGRLDSNKNQELIIRALVGLNKFKIELDLVGKGENETYLKSLVKELGLNNQVFFHGQVDDPKQFYLDADIFVLSSVFEGFPNVILESMKYGLPVISTDCKSGPREIFEISNDTKLDPIHQTHLGLVLRDFDPEVLRNAISKLIEDNNLYQKISENGGVKVRGFSSEKSLRKLKEF